MFWYLNVPVCYDNLVWVGGCARGEREREREGVDYSITALLLSVLLIRYHGNATLKPLITHHSGNLRKILFHK